MAADIEHIFQDFILNKIREIEDQSGDAGHSNEGGSNGDNVSEKVDKDQVDEDAVGSRKKHKKHKKHKSKKKKKHKEKESSSESGVESEGGTTHHLTTGGQEEQPNKEKDSQRGEDDKGHSKRHKKHSGKKKKKKKKRKKDADKSSSGSESELETKLNDAKGTSSEDRERRVGGSSRRTEDLPDIIPKQDSTKKGGDTERDGRRRRRSRSRSGSRLDRRSHRSRSRNRSRRSVTRSRSRSCRRRSRSRSRSERRLRRTRSRSPRRRSRTRSRSRGRRSTSREKGSERSQATENPLPPSLPPSLPCPAPPPLVQVSPSDPAPKEQTVAAPPASSACPSDPVLDVARSVGGWKPVPFLGVSSGKQEEPAVGSGPECPRSPHKCPTPAEVPVTESEMEAAPDSQRETSEPQNLPEPSEKPSEGPADDSSGRRAKSPARSASLETREMAEERQHETAHKTASPSKKKRDKSPGSLKKRSEGKSSSKKKKRSKSPSRKKKSKSRSPSRRKRSRSRSPARRVRRSRSRSGSRRRRGPYGGALSQRDRWKREPSHSPVLILRKNRSPARKHHCDSTSPSRITELDKEQLLEIAKANAAAMCAKAGVPIPESLRPSALSAMCLPMNLPALAMNAAMASMTAATMTAALSSMGALASMPPLPSITNKPPPGVPQANMAAMEEVKRKVAKQVNTISIKEFTDKCKKIVEKGGELAVAKPHVSDDEDDGKPFGSSALKEPKAISFSLNNMSVRPAARSDAAYAKEFPVSSGSQHRKKEGEGAYGEWVAVDKKEEKAKALAAAAAAAKTAALVPKATETPALPPAPPVAKQDSVTVPPSDSVFPDPPQEPVDIGQAVIERIKAQRRLAENPYDLNAICMLSHAQEQVDAWAQSNTIPGLFTGSTGAQVLTSEELSTGGPQAWLKKDQFLRAAPVSGGVGEFLMRKMGWRTGEGLGRNREGTVEPIIIDFKIDRKGLVAEGEKPLKQTGGLVVTKDLLGKHPVSALMELCVKRRWIQPDFIMVHHSGPDHRKNFLFKVVVNGVDYQPPSASPNKKLAKAMAATVALQAMGEVPTDGPGLYTGPVFTAASTGPLFST